MKIPIINNEIGIAKDSVLVFLPKSVNGLFPRPIQNIEAEKKYPLVFLKPEQDTFRVTEKIVETFNNSTNWTEKIKKINKKFFANK